MMGVAYSTQNTLIVLALALVLVVLSTWNTIEGIAPFQNRKPRRVTSERPGEWFNILTTYFGQNQNDDNGLGAGGVNLFRFPYTRRINDKFGTRTVYPIAMPTKDVRYYKYKILQIQNGSKSVFAQVVDECADGDCPSNAKEAASKGMKLVDIHKTMFSAIGVPRGDKKMKMKARIVSSGGKRDAQMSSVLTSDGKRGWVESHWK
jgi:hypothetical protein